MTGFKILVRMAVVAAALGALQAQAEPPRYKVEGIADFYLYGLAQAVSLNNHGQVVGYSGLGSSLTKPFLYENGKTTTLQGLEDFSIRSMNDRGDFAGVLFLEGRSVPGLYRDGEIIDLSPADGTGTGSALSLNQAGHVAGYYLPSRPGFQGLYYNGQQTLLVPGVRAFTDINDRDVLINADGFIYDHGRTEYLPRLGPDFGRNVPQAINNAGQVVGISYLGDSLSINTSFLYSDGVMKNLGSLGGNSGGALDINNSGWVVGQTMNQQGDYDAFLYLDDAMHNVEDLLVARERGQWDFGLASKINDRGQILVSVRDSPDGNFMNAILTPVPEPLSGVLMLAGLGLIGLVKSRRAARA